MEFLIVGIIIVLVLLLVTKIYLVKRDNNAKKAIYDCLSEFGEIENTVNSLYDFKLENADFIYLFKIVYNYDCREIALNSKNYWVRNGTVVSSKNSGVLIEGIYDLINKKDFEYDKNIKKIYVIYPSARTLLKTINESEVVFIKPELDCFGVKVTNFTDLKSDFNKF